MKAAGVLDDDLLADLLRDMRGDVLPNLPQHIALHLVAMGPPGHRRLT
jgi:hypothetical protein